MAPKIFLTGGTGYVGGTVLDTIVKTHPEYEITALLRNEPPHFRELYPNVRIVRGDYDAVDLLSETASKSDIVIHNGNSDHEPSIRALVDGLLKSEKVTFLIHLSGTGLVADWRENKGLGKINPKIWGDIDNIDEITSRPDGELHRHTDKFIQQVAVKNSDRLKTAIMSPPDIYGPGRGPGKTQSVYFPAFVDEIKTVGAAFYAGDGTNTRSWVHIEDLMKVYLRLVEAAVAGGGSADWGLEGYYFASSQEHSQIDIARAVGKVLKSHGVVESADPAAIPLDRVDAMLASRNFPHLGSYMFAANSRTRAQRAPKVLGYVPTAPDLWDSLEADLKSCL